MIHQFMIQGTGNVISIPTKTGGMSYDKFFIYIPTNVAKDSALSFKPGEEVVVRIEKG